MDSDNNVRSYGYEYDALNRLLKANFKKNNFETRSYDETLTYDKNGNIRTLLRNGSADYDDVGMAFPIDNLKYTYSVLNKSNQLIAVVDDENSTEGFNDVNKVGADFVYDSFGNMIMDLNKNITAIKYNHLNLPTQIKFNTDGANEINYLYNAVGVKVGKKVKSTTPGIGVVENKTDYLNGFQYLTSPSIAGKLQFFPTAEGYVKTGIDEKLDYVYNYTDHLGNVRVSYSDLDNNGILGDEMVTICSDPDPVTGLRNCRSSFVNPIIEENHYYPFGLEHKGYDYSNSQENYQYKYNGKEYQDELSLNWYDYQARNYDPAIGRWMNIDPLAEVSRRFSPYTYALNNPVRFTDPDGMMADDSINPKFQDEATKNTYVSTVENATGGLYKVTADPLVNGGNVVFTQVAEGPVTQEQQAFIDEYSAVVNSLAVVDIDIVSDDICVDVGNFQNNQIDMADVAKFDLAGKGGSTSAGALIHETVEQLKKAEMGLSKGELGRSSTNSNGNTAPPYLDYDIAHAQAMQAENRVNGNERTEGSKFKGDTFLEKNGTTTRQLVIPQAGGTVNVMKK